MSAKWLGIFAILSLLLISGMACAEPLRLTMNKNRIVYLEQDATSVIVNNPDHATVILDNPRMLIIVPHQPGATSMTVLNDAGNTILQQDIIVTNVQPKYVRIRRICGGSDTSCVAATYSYCPDGCYEVSAVAAGSAAVAPPPTAASGPQGTAAPALIDGEPPETLIGPADNCPTGYTKRAVAGAPTDQGFTCGK